MTPQVYEYIRGEDNAAPGHATDQCNRFLATGDQVAFGFATDQGNELALIGTVSALFEHGGVNICGLDLEPAFTEYFGTQYTIAKAKSTIRLPAPGKLRDDLVQFFIYVNRHVTRTTKLTINGKTVIV